MKRLSTIAAAAVCGGMVLISELGARGQETGFYAKGDIGGNITQDIDLKEFFDENVSGSKVKLDPGFRLGFGAGYQFNPYLATELELGFMVNEIDAITGASALHDASYWNVPFLLNAKLQYPNRSLITPYAGAGVGFSATGFDIDYVRIGHVEAWGTDTEAVFAWQAFAGLRYSLNERMGLSLEYRYFWADDAEFESDWGHGSMAFGSVTTHVISLAFDFKF